MKKLMATLAGPRRLRGLMGATRTCLSRREVDAEGESDPLSLGKPNSSIVIGLFSRAASATAQRTICLAEFCEMIRKNECKWI